MTSAFMPGRGFQKQSDVIPGNDVFPGSAEPLLGPLKTSTFFVLALRNPWRWVWPVFLAVLAFQAAPPSSRACVAMATALMKVESATSTVAWQVSRAGEKESPAACAEKASDALEEILEYQEEYYEEIQTHGDPKLGHSLKQGRWVVVSVVRKIGKSKIKNYGLGADAESWAEAERKAALDLARSDPGWDRKKTKYRVEDKGKF